MKKIYCDNCGNKEDFEMVKRLKIWDADKGKWIKDDEDEHECIICMNCGSNNVEEYNAQSNDDE